MVYRTCCAPNVLKIENEAAFARQHRCYREFDHVEVAERPGYNELGDPRAVETEREETQWNR